MLGVGAIGGVIGGYLSRAKNDVTLIDPWPANVDRIRTRGLAVTSLEEEFTVRPSALHLGDVSSLRRSFDAVVLAVKSYDTSWSARFIEPYLAPGGFIISAQNGINEEAIAAVVGWPRVVGCVVFVSAELSGPGHVLRNTSINLPTFAVGEPSGLATRRIEELCDLLAAVGPTRTTANLWGERWSKLGMYCMDNAVGVILGTDTAGVRGNPQARGVSIRVASEAVSVATALGVTVGPMHGIPADMFIEAIDNAAKKREVERKILDSVNTLGTGKSSLAQDVMKGRKMEVEYMNGYIVSKGREVGIPTPVNDSLVELIKRVETGDLKPSMSNLSYVP